MNVRQILQIVILGVCLSMTLAVAAAEPSDRFRHAQQLLQANELEAAASEFSALRDEYPGDVDYALALAQVLARQGRDDAALQELADAAHLAPDYEAVWRLRLILLARQTDAAYAGNLESVRQEAAERFPTATWWRLPENPPQWTVLAGAGYSDLSAQLPSWNHQFAEISRDVKGEHRYGLQVRRAQRYREADYAIGLNGERTFTSGWNAGLTLEFAGNPAFQPELGYRVHASKPFAKDWVGGLGYRRREYATTTVGSVTGNIERYWGEYRFAYRLSHSHLHGASDFQSHAGTIDWYFSDRAHAGLTISTGKEAEILGNGQVLESSVSGLSASGRYQFSPRIGLHWWLGTHQQGDFYRRQFLGMAVSIRL
ncbi:MAG: YaiO family outer membrane beta-barrel protein [Gammaproteobacteria bacterium]|nr:YaiO family outer membrane beta-barrel protein [Gammaproteobacteria bacterium]